MTEILTQSKGFDRPSTPGRIAAIPRIHNADSGDVELYIYGEIGEDWWTGEGITGKSVAAVLKDVPRNKRISLRINSPGGDVGEALAIYNLLSERRSKLTTYIDGYALSAASFIGLAAKKVVIPEASIVMLHNPWGMAIGDSTAMRKTAEVLDTHRDAVISIYQKRTKKPYEDLVAILDAETWMTGAEAVEFGLADELIDAAPVDDVIPMRFKEKVSNSFTEQFGNWRFGAPNYAGQIAAKFQPKVVEPEPEPEPETEQLELQPVNSLVVDQQEQEINMSTQSPEFSMAAKDEIRNLTDRIAAKDTEISNLKAQIGDLEVKAAGYKESLKVAQDELTTVKNRQSATTLYHGLRRQAENLVRNAQLSKNEFDRFFGEDADTDIDNVLNSGRYEIRMGVIGEYLEEAKTRSPLLNTRQHVVEKIEARPETPEDAEPKESPAIEQARNLIANAWKQK